MLQLSRSAPSIQDMRPEHKSGRMLEKFKVHQQLQAIGDDSHL
jgi:hypothetical protein